MGFVVIAVRNSNHLGMLAWYVEQMAALGLVAIASTTSEALVHPWGGRKAMLGTNPLAIAVPANPQPLVLDMATSLVSMGKIHDYANRGEPIPGDWALDADGNPTTNAAAAKEGAIAPFGGPKGYALGLALEVLVASLSGTALGTDVRGTLDSAMVCNKGDVFILISQKRAGNARETVSVYLDKVRATSPSDPTKPVAVPGDRARCNRSRSIVEGLNLDEALLNDLAALGSS